MTQRKKTPRLPFLISAQPRGTQKAFDNFVREYGYMEGSRIFILKAEEQGTGNTARQKANSIYKRGGHLKSS
jgi:hypothetical protein